MVLIALINGLISSEAFKDPSCRLPALSLVDELASKVKASRLDL